MQHLSHQQYLVGAQEWQGKTEAQGAMAGAAILLRIPCFRLFRFFFAVNLFRSCLAQSCDVMGLFQCYCPAVGYCRSKTFQAAASLGLSASKASGHSDSK